MIAIEASYVPQIARLFRLKRADDVSLFFPSLNALGRVLALTYSVLSHQPVFVAGFILGLCLRTTLLVQVIWYRKLSKRATAPEAKTVTVSTAAAVATTGVLP